MLTGAQEYLFTRLELAIYPGIAIVLLVLAFNLLGDALRDVLSPQRVRRSDIWNEVSQLI